MATYYVTQGGTGDGTSYANACSVAELNANTHFTPAGDDVIYLCDTITSTVTPPTSGTGETDRITYRGDYAGHSAVVNSSDIATGILINTKDYITITGITVTGNAASDYGIWLYKATNCIVSGCTVSSIGAVGSAYPAEGILVDSAGSNTVTGNTVYECGRHGIAINGAASATTSNIIEHNTIYNCYHTGIDMTNTGGAAAHSGNIIRYNKIYTTDSYADDAVTANGIYGDGIVDHPVDATQIYYNVIYNAMGSGIKNGNYMTNTVIYNNSFYSTDAACTDIGAGGIVIHATGVSGITIKNNIAIDAINGGLFLGNSAVITACENNLWYHSGGGTAKYTNIDGTTYHFDDQAAYKAATGWDDTGVWADPLFVSTTNLRLQSSSPCRNAGVDLGLTRDFRDAVVPCGSNPDIGAFETYLYPDNIIYDFVAS